MAKSPQLLDRLLKTPDLAKIVPRLAPEILHRVIQHRGLEDCSEVVALATPAQLTRILDVDIWRVRTAGGDDELDADRFGVWLTVLMQSGAAVAAKKLAGLDVELVIAGLARHLAVFDYLAVASYTTLDGEHVLARARDRDLAFEIGGYAIEARRTSAWDAIVDLLAFLDVEHPEYFHRLMRGCVGLSDGPREQDGLHDLMGKAEQDTFDLACDREARRERQGYVAPAQAGAFLRAARELRLDADRPPPSALARAHFRAIEPPAAVEIAKPEQLQPDRMGEVVEVLREAGVLTSTPRALPGARNGETSRFSSIETHVASHPASAEELAYLANVIIAGSSVQGRPFTPREGADAAVAICNLGLENWPPHWPDRDLLTAFQIGWTTLHRDVCMFTAECVIDVLAEIRCTDREVQLRLDGLRRELVAAARVGAPWRARDALDAILMLDAPSWAALLSLIGECPVIHAVVRAPRHCLTIYPDDFEFISENREIVAVRQFMASLRSNLTR